MFWGKHMLQLTHYCHISIPYHLHTFCGLILLMLSLRSGVSTIRSRDQSPPGRDFSLGPVDNFRKYEGVHRFWTFKVLQLFLLVKILPTHHNPHGNSVSNFHIYQNTTFANKPSRTFSEILRNSTFQTQSVPGGHKKIF